MTLLDVLLGLVAIVVSFAVMTSICFLGGAIFYRFYNNKSKTMEEVILKKRKKGKRRK